MSAGPSRAELLRDGPPGNQVTEKTDRIKRWVAARLQELDTQSTILHRQHRLCKERVTLLGHAQQTADIRRSSAALLAGAARCTAAHAQVNIMESSCPPCYNATGNNSPDSGAPCSETEFRISEFSNNATQRVLDYGNVMSLSVDAANQMGHCDAEGALEAYFQHNCVRLVGVAQTPETPKKKPIPVPRTLTHKPNVLELDQIQNGSQIPPDTYLIIERDSLDITSSQHHHQQHTVHECDYVNVHELGCHVADMRNECGGAADFGNAPPPPLPKHGCPSVQLSDLRLTTLASQCFNATCSASDGTENFDNQNLHCARLMPKRQNSENSRRNTQSSEGQCAENVARNTSDSSNMLLPVFTTRHASSSRACSTSSSTHNQKEKLRDSDGASDQVHTVEIGNLDQSQLHYASTSLYVDRNKTMGLGGGKCRKNGPPCSYNSVDDNSSDDYALPPDACDNKSLHMSLMHGYGKAIQGEPSSSKVHLQSPAKSGLVPVKSGYLQLGTESRFRSLKRRWAVLESSGKFSLYKSHKDEKSTRAVYQVSAADMSALHTNPKSPCTFELVTVSGKQTFTCENVTVCQSWQKAINKCMKAGDQSNTAFLCTEGGNGKSGDLQHLSEASVYGWLTRVKCAESKRCFAAIIGDQLHFYKAPHHKVPFTSLPLQGTNITLATHSSSSSSDNDSDQPCASNQVTDCPHAHRPDQHGWDSMTLCVHTGAVGQSMQQPVYLVLACREEKYKWQYHLTLASNGIFLNSPSNSSGSPNKTAKNCTDFENLIRKMMHPTINGVPESELWSDPVLTPSLEAMGQAPKTTLICKNVRMQNLQNCDAEVKKALEIAKASHLFCTVSMQPASALHYHIDLAQTALNAALHCPHVCDELYAILIRLSLAKALRVALQAWRLLALSCAVAIPSNYALLWLLQKHLDRTVLLAPEKSEQHELAVYMQHTLHQILNTPVDTSKSAGSAQNNNKVSFKGRKCRPSRLEAQAMLAGFQASQLASSAATHRSPMSVAVRLPDGSSHTVEFGPLDRVNLVTSRLCQSLSVRHPSKSGFALYIDAPESSSRSADGEPKRKYLDPKEILCDCLSQWEQQHTQSYSGRVPSCVIPTMYLQLRLNLPDQADGKTYREMIYFVFACADKMRHGLMQVNADFVAEFCAMTAQMSYGAYNESKHDVAVKLTRQFCPDHLLSDQAERDNRLNVSRNSEICTAIMQSWSHLPHNLSPSNCAQALSHALTKCPITLGTVFHAKLAWRNGMRVVLMVDKSGVKVVEDANLYSYSYSQVLSFGGCRNGDFMITVDRSTVRESGTVDGPVKALNRHCEESNRARLTFQMPKEDVYEVTFLIADYIKISG